MFNNRASARADTQMTHRKESNNESGHNTKWLITANGPLQSWKRNLEDVTRSLLAAKIRAEFWWMEGKEELCVVSIQVVI